MAHFYEIDSSRSSSPAPSSVYDSTNSIFPSQRRQVRPQLAASGHGPTPAAILFGATHSQLLQARNTAYTELLKERDNVRSSLARRTTCCLYASTVVRASMRYRGLQHRPSDSWMASRPAPKSGQRKTERTILRLSSGLKKHGATIKRSRRLNRKGVSKRRSPSEVKMLTLTLSGKAPSFSSTTTAALFWRRKRVPWATLCARSSLT